MKGVVLDVESSTHESLAETSIYIETIEKCQGLKVACLEGIAYQQGRISANKLLVISRPLAKNQYGQYLLRVAWDYKVPF